MRNPDLRWIASTAILLGVWSHLMAQEASKGKQPEQRPQTLYQKLEAAGATGGPAPQRDLNGSWTGPLTPKMGAVPPLTAMGQARFKQNIPDTFSPSSNDPWI